MTKTNWRKLFREFYDDNESGGSSRWKVAPNIVELFIESRLQESLREAVELSDKIESEGETTFEEWRGFKRFRNTLRDRLDTELKSLEGVKDV